MSKEAFSVVVIGGGVIGTSVAYYLAKEGVDVALVERGGLCSGTSKACDGFIALENKTTGPNLQLALRSIKLYEELAGELDHNIEYRQCGGLLLAKTEEELDSLRILKEELKQAGLETELVDRSDLRMMESALSSEIIGGLHSPSDGQVNPMKATLELARASQKYGAKIFTYEGVCGIIKIKDSISSVVTNSKTIHTKFVVNASWVWAPLIGEMVGLNIPVVPRQGQLLVTEKVPPLLNKVMLAAGYLTVKYGDRGREELGVSFAGEQTKDGGILIGSSRQFVGYSTRVELRVIKAIAHEAISFIPRLKDIHCIRTYAGLRPYTPDHLPILGKVDEIEGFIIAAGHEGDGVALAPITGKLIAELITKGKTSISLDRFNLARFKKGDI